MRFRYCYLTTPDPKDPFVHCRHRVDRFCRTCQKHRIEACPCDNIAGSWEKDQIKWKEGPKVLPSDGMKTIRRKRKKPVMTPSQTDPELPELPPVKDIFLKTEFIMCLDETNTTELLFVVEKFSSTDL